MSRDPGWQRELKVTCEGSSSKKHQQMEIWGKGEEGERLKEHDSFTYVLFPIHWVSFFGNHHSASS